MTMISPVDLIERIVCSIPKGIGRLVMIELRFLNCLGEAPLTKLIRLMLACRSFLLKRYLRIVLLRDYGRKLALQ